MNCKNQTKMIIISLAVDYSMFAKELKSIGTIKYLGEGENLYSMEYKGIYGLEEILAQGRSFDEDVEALHQATYQKDSYIIQE